MPSSIIRFLAIAVWVLAGCSDPPNAASVRVTPETAVIPLGTSLQLEAVALDCCGNPINEAHFTWSSSNPSAISVSDAGLITAASHGSATITVSVDGVSANVDAAVAPEFSQISVGSNMACGLSPTGAASCWGYDPATGNPLVRTPYAVPGGLTFVQVTAGSIHACGITTSGAAYCWGDNSFGQLGSGLSPSPQCGPRESQAEVCPTPIAVAGGLTFISLSAGEEHTCGVLANGDAYCWGWNNWAQLGAVGDDSCGRPCSPVPVLVRGGLVFAQIDAGFQHTCAVTTTGAAYCWGINLLGELGIGHLGDRADVPTPVAGGLTFSSVDAGFQHSCGVSVGGTGWCWGSGDYGALGNGTSGTAEPAPVQISGSLALASITAGARVSCALTTSGVGYCWGGNSQGTLGNATLQDSNVPVPVFGGLTFTSISVSNNLTTCGVTDFKVGYCWGRSYVAGSNTPGNYIDRPHIVGG